MPTIFYQSLKIYCSSALGLYFRKWEVHGALNIPDGPVIFVPNHQNAFLDAILVTCSSKKNPWFLTRANVFDKPAVANLLNKMQMLPIYRFRDGFATLKKNDQVMDNVVQKLNEGHSILIFAEGNHNERDNLGPLQKGVARMAMAVDKNSNVAIVPVGIRYDSRTGFRTQVLINFGAPLYLKDFSDSAATIPDQIESVLTKLRNELEPLMLHIDTENYHEKLNHLKIYRQQHRGLRDQLHSDQSIIKSYPNSGPDSNYQTNRPVWKDIMMWYVKLNSLIPLFIIRNLILSKIKDPQFVGSVKFAGGMLLAPVFWGLQAFVLFSLTGSVMLAAFYLVSLPLSVKWS